MQSSQALSESLSVPLTLTFVLAVALVQKLQEQTQESIQLWVAFGTGTNLPYVPAHEIASSLGENTALALPAFHAFSGCDLAVSCFFGKSKKTALETWNSFLQITPIFIALSVAPQHRYMMTGCKSLGDMSFCYMIERVAA